jgi:hypothetical protein
LGSQALQNGNSTGNVAIGFRSLFGSSGGNNTAVGYQAGNFVTTGSLNTFIGYDADATANNLTNATAIGANAIVGSSNSLVLGNNTNVGIGTSTPNQNASLDLGDNDRGLQLNRVDTTTLQPSLGLSDHGLVVYDTVINELFVWNGSNFSLVGGAGGANDTIPANVFSARIDGQPGTPDPNRILTQSYPFLQNVSRGAPGAYNVIFLPGFFTEIPSVSVTENHPSLAPIDASVVNLSVGGFSVYTGLSNVAVGDNNFHILVQRQGTDYQNTLIAPPNVIGQWDLNGADLSYSGGNVGVGIINPDDAFEVIGGSIDIELNQSYKAGNEIVLQRQASGVFVGSNLVTPTIMRAGSEVARFTTTGELAIGTTTANDRVEIVGGSIDIELGQAYKAGNEIVLQRTGGGVFVGSNLVTPTIIRAGGEIARFTTTGNLGIGTTTPNAQLQLASTLNNRKIVLFEGANNDHQFFGFGVNPAELRYQVNGNFASHVFYSSINTTSSLELMRILGNGNVGIGVTSPQEKLQISSSAVSTSLLVTNDAVGTTNTDGLLIGENNAGLGIILNNENERLLIGTNANFGQMVFDPNGNIGISQATPLYRLDVNGGIRSGDEGQSGQLRLYSEQGGTDYEVVFNPNPAMTINTTYTLPSDDGAASDVLTTDGNGLLSWGSATGLNAGSGLTLNVNDLDLGGALNQNTIIAQANYAFTVGVSNIIAGPQQAEIILGNQNTVTGFGGISIGTSNIVAGNRGIAIGSRVEANHLGAIVMGDWSSSSPGLTASSTSDQFTARFNAGYRFYADSDPIANPNTGMFINNAGFVGIGTTNPSELLDVDNGGSIEVDGEYTYESSKTHFLSVSAAKFRSVNSTEVFTIAGPSTNTTADMYGYFTGSVTSQYAHAVSDVQLPDGATITSVTAYVYDNEPNSLAWDQAEVGLRRQPLDGSSGTELASCLFSGNSTAVQTIVTPLISNNVVNNSFYIYTLTFIADRDPVSFGNQRFYGVRITYTVDQAD